MKHKPQPGSVVYYVEACNNLNMNGVGVFFWPDWEDVGVFTSKKAALACYTKFKLLDKREIRVTYMHCMNLPYYDKSVPKREVLL
jgi:hypothetical protein